MSLLVLFCHPVLFSPAIRCNSSLLSISDVIMGRLVRCYIPLSSRDCPICILKFSSVNQFKFLAWSVGMPMTWSSPFWPAWSPGMWTQWESRDQAWDLHRARYASSPLGDFSCSPHWSVFHKSLHPWLSLLFSSCETLFSFFFPYRDLALFFSVSLQNLA